jgi:hypothetical protein
MRGDDMSYTVTSNIEKLTLNETDTVASVLQNVAIILSTWRGEVPLYRDFGLSPDLLHRPIDVAKAQMRSEIMEAVEEYEPRANIVSISFEADELMPDVLRPVLEIEIEGEEEDGT